MATPQVVEMTEQASEIPPPAYDGHATANRASSDDKVGRQLKESFAELLKEQLNVQRLFATVLARLEHTQRIGSGHTLYKEWEELREVWTVVSLSRRLWLIVFIFSEASKASSLLARECRSMCQLSPK
jgi:hypothetical protein